jgi:hypothetical protein
MFAVGIKQLLRYLAVYWLNNNNNKSPDFLTNHINFSHVGSCRNVSKIRNTNNKIFFVPTSNDTEQRTKNDATKCPRWGVALRYAEMQFSSWHWLTSGSLM